MDIHSSHNDTPSTESKGVSAEFILAKHFARLRDPTKYIAAFRTPSDRHLALGRNVKSSINLWTETAPPEGMKGVEINNAKRPGCAYEPDQPRNSNLTTASNRLGFGNTAYYLKFETVGALESYVEWYAEL